MSRTRQIFRPVNWGLWLVVIMAVLVMAHGLPTRVLSAPAVESALPRILSHTDQARYRQIFDLQQAGRWKQARRLIAEIEDPVLLGHVDYQRLMHPTAWRSSYRELHEWLARHADHPLSEKIYDLAERRRPASGWKALTRPRAVSLQITGTVAAPGTERLAKPEQPQLSRHDRTMLRSIRRLVYRNAPTRALKNMSLQDGQRMGSDARALAHALIARGYLTAGYVDKAIKAAELAVGGTGPGRMKGAFLAGISYWAEDRKEEAHAAFGIALGPESGPLTGQESAAGIWRARSALATGDFLQVLPALRRASLTPRDMYGQIARRLLARESGFDWQPPTLTEQQLAAVLQFSGVRRALALAEVGQIGRADMELRLMATRANRAGLDALLRLAAHIDAPATALRFARRRLNSHGERHDPALYPAPEWPLSPEVHVDRALVYAIARRESGFDPLARSSAGARGVMQLMPTTARYVARIAGQPRPTNSSLHDPRQNIRLGQAYIRYVLKAVRPQDNLVLTIAAYNAGPGNAAKWAAKQGVAQDPLLFLELMGSAETRTFARDVLSSLWIYRDRLGQPAPSLDALAAGRWPLYQSLDPH
ncbi:MAG: lytic transglycosylase domain-containing protein [Minwuia sp.]|nr:lytic transglycosylase domain-containing protein [Minwuia sp.]